MERSTQAVAAVVATGAIALVGALALRGQGGAPPPAPPAVSAIVSSAPPPSSTIAPRDYAGPTTCLECHEKMSAKWKGHPHRAMNRDATAETVRGDFSGVTA